MTASTVASSRIARSTGVSGVGAKRSGTPSRVATKIKKASPAAEHGVQGRVLEPAQATTGYAPYLPFPNTRGDRLTRVASGHSAFPAADHISAGAAGQGRSPIGSASRPGLLLSPAPPVNIREGAVFFEKFVALV